MFDDFFTRALLGAIGVALIAGPVGCIMLWQRKAYFGDTMAHSALLGAALGGLLGLDPVIGVFVVAILVAMMVVVLRRGSSLASDSILGVLSHSTLAIGLLIMALARDSRLYDLNVYLFGDVLSIHIGHLAVIWGGGAASLLLLIWIWRALVATTLHENLAAAEGVHPLRTQFLYMILVAAIVAVGMRVTGVLLIVAMMIVPAAAARALSHTPEQMAILAAGIGVLSAILGLNASLWVDVPAAPAIVTVAFLCFVLSISGRWLLHQTRRRKDPHSASLQTPSKEV